MMTESVHGSDARAAASAERHRDHLPVPPEYTVMYYVWKQGKLQIAIPDTKHPNLQSAENTARAFVARYVTDHVMMIGVSEGFRAVESGGGSLPVAMAVYVSSLKAAPKERTHLEQMQITIQYCIARLNHLLYIHQFPKSVQAGFGPGETMAALEEDLPGMMARYGITDSYAAERAEATRARRLQEMRAFDAPTKRKFRLWKST